MYPGLIATNVKYKQSMANPVYAKLGELFLFHYWNKP